ncbi:MAG: hypothetical protein HZB36_03550 [Candidatus Omnitrophica bacterium]|nr:hypothetical protein [Candidatus Omnitrophota bacterium]
MSNFIAYSRAGYDDLFLLSLPESAIFLRGFFFAVLRIAGLAAGLGVLTGKEIFRKTALFVAVARVLTFFSEHPYYAVKKHVEAAVAFASLKTGIFKIAEAPTVGFITKFSFFVLFAIDVGFAAVLIYYCTRPQVRQWFKEKG